MQDGRHQHYDIGDPADVRQDGGDLDGMIDVRGRGRVLPPLTAMLVRREPDGLEQSSEIRDESLLPSGETRGPEAGE
jgi:hypothetical protein